MKADKPAYKPEKKEKPKRPPFHVEFAEKVIAHLEAGTAPWQRPWHPGKTSEVPHNPVSGTVYRGMNRVALGFSDFDDPRWMTLKQANEQGLSILPGSKATPVVYFQFSKEQERLNEDGKPVLGEDGKPLMQKVELDRPIIRYAHVFNAEQIDGMPALELTDKSFDWNPSEKAESILSASGATIKHDQSNRAFYRYATDDIHLPPKENFDAPDKYYATALHELGHWTRHESRLNRENGPFGSEMYAREELRAEIASWMLGQDIGIGHDPGQHAAYVQSWIKVLKEDPFEIMRACRDAEQIKEYVLGLEMKKELQQEQPEKTIRRAVQPEREEGVAAMGVPAAPATVKTFLAVPYKEKEQAKKLGAKWDKENKLWYAPEGTDLTPLAAWMPQDSVSKEHEKWREEIRASDKRIRELEKQIAQEVESSRKEEMLAGIHSEQKLIEKCWGELEKLKRVADAAKAPEKTVHIPPQEEFARALEAAGLDLRGNTPIMDGAIHRVPLIDGKRGELDGAYCGFLDERPAGWIQNFSTGEKVKWLATGHSLSKEEMEAQRAEIAQKQLERAEQRKQAQEKAAALSKEAWNAGIKASDDHPYLKAKGVPSIGLHENRAGVLHVPVHSVHGELRGLQTIDDEGRKRFVPGMEKSGNFCFLTEPGKDLSQGEILLAEGYATGASLHMATGNNVAVAFDAGNLEPVARALREKYPNAAIVICADNDHQHTRRTPDGKEELWNKGVAMAQKAAKAVGGKVVAPIFNEEERARGLTDFNDLHQSRGIGEVKKQLGLVLQQDTELEKSHDKGKTRELSL